MLPGDGRGRDWKVDLEGWGSGVESGELVQQVGESGVGESHLGMVDVGGGGQHQAWPRKMLMGLAEVLGRSHAGALTG